MTDNSKLVSIIQKKELEIDNLQSQLKQKTQLIDAQTQALNRMIDESQKNQAITRAENEKQAPHLSSQRINDFRTILQLANSTAHRSAKTPSPSRSFAVLRTLTPENNAIPFKVGPKFPESNKYR